MEKNFLILELGTGLVDGYYTEESLMPEMKLYWDDYRSQYPHLIVSVVGDDLPYLPDEMMMNQAGREVFSVCPDRPALTIVRSNGPKKNF